MRRVKPAPELHKAGLLLLRRRLARWLPRGSGRFILAGFGLVALIGGGMAAADRLDHGSRVPHLIQAATGALGLRIESVEVEGRGVTSRNEILEALGAARGTPLLAVDPAHARNELLSLPWVRTALVERELPDTIRVVLTERQPLALWQHHGQMALIDRDGDVVTTDRLDRFVALPLVVGDGAPAHAAELIHILATQPDLAKRVTASIWVGDRRWNLHFDNGIEVEMPEHGFDVAWAHLAEIERDHAILARDIDQVDLRFADRVVVRLAPEPAKPAAAHHGGKAAARST